MSVKEVLEKALAATLVDESLLRATYGSACIKDELDKLNKSRATQSLALASLVAKGVHPDWDTRIHEVQQKVGAHNLRGVSGKVNGLLHERGLLPTSTDYACLTPAFKGVGAPFDKHFTGNIKPRESLPALLNILELINTTATPELLNSMLLYILSGLHDKKKKDEAERQTKVDCSNQFSLQDVSNILRKIDSLHGADVSKLPVIVAHAVLSVVQPYLLQRLSVVPLKEHTEADKDRSYGDVEAVDSSSAHMIAIEVKHKIPINDSIMLTFDNKTKGKAIPLKFILSTAKTEKRYKDDICIDTVDGFVTTYLQMGLLHEKNICSIFLQELRKKIISHDNLYLDTKKAANEILTALLASPSP
jgi:hypothetical protein